MPMTLMKARKRPNGSFWLVVHLDASKTLGDGSPDPAWVREYQWPSLPEGMTQANYVTQIKQETKLLAQAEADAMKGGEGTALAGEGTPL